MPEYPKEAVVMVGDSCANDQLHRWTWDGDPEEIDGGMSRDMLWHPYSSALSPFITVPGETLLQSSVPYLGHLTRNKDITARLKQRKSR